MENNQMIDSRALDKKVALRSMPLIILCAIFANLDRMNVGFAKLQMTADLGFSETMFGFGAGLFFIAYAAFGLPSNIALDKFGAKRWICTIMIIWGALTAIMYMVQTPQQFYAVRFLLGAAEAGFFPGIVLYISRWFPKRRRATMTAWYTIAIPIAGIIGGPISGLIIDSMDMTNGLRGWQWMFILEGVPVIFLALIVLKYLPNTVQDSHWLTPAEKQYIMNELQSEEKAKVESITSFSAIFFNKYIWILVLIYFSLRLSLNTLQLWTPTFIHGAGISSNFSVGLLSALPYIVGVAFMFYIGKSSDTKGERRWHLFIPMMLTAIGLCLAGAMSTNVVFVVIGLMLAGMGSTAALPLYWQFPQAFLSTAMLAAGLGIISSFGSLASFGAPYMIGWMRDHIADPGMALYVISFVIVLGSLTIFTIPAKSVNQKDAKKAADNEVSGAESKA
ncbi:MAG: MFS transporter [Acinetobacter sp.]